MDKSLAICKVCRTAIKYSGSTTNLKTAAWRKLLDANVSNVTASTSKNTQDNDMAIKDFFQPQLSHNSARSRVIMASIA